MTIPQLKIEEIKYLFYVKKIKKKKISQEVGVSYSKVRNIIKNFESAKFRSETNGQKKKYDSSKRFILNDQHKLKIENYIKRFSKASYSDIKRELDIPGLNKSTIQRFCIKNDIKTFASLNKTGLTNEVKLDRKNFSNHYLNVLKWNKESFKHMVFTDETVIYSHYNSKNSAKTTESGLDSNLQPSRRTFMVVIYGHISLNCRGIFRIDGEFNSNKYYELLVQSGLLDLINSSNPAPVHFLQDNSPCHQTPANKPEIATIINSKNMVYVNLPPYSMDLNCIENIWVLLKQKVTRKMNSRLVNNEDELWNVIQEAWNEIDDLKIENTIKSMPKRLKRVLNSGGEMTNFVI